MMTALLRRLRHVFDSMFNTGRPPAFVLWSRLSDDFSCRGRPFLLQYIQISGVFYGLYWLKRSFCPLLVHLGSTIHLPTRFHPQLDPSNLVRPQRTRLPDYNEQDRGNRFQGAAFEHSERSTQPKSHPRDFVEKTGLFLLESSKVTLQPWTLRQPRTPRGSMGR